MARYTSDFAGIPARFVRPEGLDPNYREGYRGMRIRGGHGRAVYGAQRYDSRDDLGSMGGYGGIHQAPARRRLAATPQEATGGVGDPNRDSRLLRHFNANSPSLRRERRPSGGYDREMSRKDPERDWMPDRRFRPGYSSRGVSPAGYGEGWASWPLRGGR